VKAEDFDTVFYPGGHGPMWDLAESPTSIALLEAFYNSGKPIALVCHSPGVLRHVTYQGAPLVKGKHVAGFTNGEEEEMQLTKVVPFLVEDELLRLGAIYEKVANWQPFSITDGRLVTGQNPASSTSAAQALLKLMTVSESDSSMNGVQIEHKSYEMPPRDGISVAHFLTVADVDRSARFYEKVFDGRILSKGDSDGAPAYIQIANTWLLVNPGGGPTPDKPNYGKVEEPSSSPSRSPSTAKRAATSAILTVILSRSDRAPISSTVNARPRVGCDLNAYDIRLVPARWRERYNAAQPHEALNWQAPWVQA
jgi:putative intracellular protease/amidase